MGLTSMGSEVRCNNLDTAPINYMTPDKGIDLSLLNFLV